MKELKGEDLPATRGGAVGHRLDLRRISPLLRALASILNSADSLDEVKVRDLQQGDDPREGHHGIARA